MLSIACALQTVSERLSQHVLNNYSKFVAGVTEVASVERDLQVPSLPLTFSEPVDVLCSVWLV